MRYDGIYRIKSCWRKPGAQGKLMCRYLFVRCDNEPAPWSSEGARPHRSRRLATSSGRPRWPRALSPGPGLYSSPTCCADTGDRPLAELPKEALAEIKQADKGTVFSTADSPWWDWDEGKQVRTAMRPAGGRAAAWGHRGGEGQTHTARARRQVQGPSDLRAGVRGATPPEQHWSQSRLSAGLSSRPGGLSVAGVGLVARAAREPEGGRRPCGPQGRAQARLGAGARPAGVHLRPVQARAQPAGQHALR